MELRECSFCLEYYHSTQSYRFNVRAFGAILVTYSLCSLVVSALEVRRSYNVSEQWTSWSSCSQSCGSGISRQRRQCSSTHCTGAQTRYRSCNSQECTSTPPDLRSVQCAAYNSKLSRGGWVRWTSLDPLPDEEQCQLVCMSYIGGHKHYIRARVQDGTKCMKGVGVCLDGRCMTLGCDGVLGTAKIEDKCHRCVHADNTTSPCRRFVGQSFIPHSQHELHNLVQVPSGASYLNVTTVGGAKTIIKVTTLAGQYVIFNGTKVTTVPLAGTDFTLVKLQSCPYCIEKWTLLAKGPTTSVIDIQVMDTASDIAALFSYNMVEKTEPLQQVSRKRRFSPFQWSLRSPTPCSVTCGNGTRVTAYQCLYIRSSGSKLNVPDRYCPRIKPSPLVEVCEMADCLAEWSYSEWGNCSASCGRGYRTRTVHCVQRISEMEKMSVNSSFCDHLPRPSIRETCQLNPCTAQWITSNWLECQGGCGENRGVQGRVVLCYENNGRLVGDDRCADYSKPVVRRPCTKNCSSGRWISYEWNKCTGQCGAGGGVRTRVVHCVVDDEGESTVTIEDNCPAPKPPSQEVCDIECTWYIGEWSSCSRTCGQGVQGRVVKCTNETGSSVSGCSGVKPDHQQNCMERECSNCSGNQFSTNLCRLLDNKYHFCGEDKTSSQLHNFCCLYCSKKQRR